MLNHVTLSCLEVYGHMSHTSQSLYTNSVKADTILIPTNNKMWKIFSAHNRFHASLILIKLPNPQVYDQLC